MPHDIALALISAGGTLLGATIPMVWGLGLDKECRRFHRMLRESHLRELALMKEKRELENEVTRWHALYINDDVGTRRTLVFR